VTPRGRLHQGRAQLVVPGVHGRGLRRRQQGLHGPHIPPLGRIQKLLLLGRPVRMHTPLTGAPWRGSLRRQSGPDEPHVLTRLSAQDHRGFARTTCLGLGLVQAAGTGGDGAGVGVGAGSHCPPLTTLLGQTRRGEGS
jgi:hypothetical protein